MPNALVIATETEKLGVYEAANVVHFPLQDSQLATISVRLMALGENLASEQFHREFFPSGDEWRED